jgi:hypothetical protein
MFSKSFLLVSETSKLLRVSLKMNLIPLSISLEKEKE